MSKRQILLNPGPVTLTERVRGALTRGDWCHREPEFANLMQSINARLVRVYEETAEGYEAVTITGSGTSAVEGMLQSFAPRESKTLIVANGVYGERMAAMLDAQGKPKVLLEGEWLKAIDVTLVAKALDANAEITHLVVVHHETTTGRLNDLNAIGALCKERGIAMLLDAVSSFAAEKICFADWNVAAVAATANKCLHAAPGLSFVIARSPLWKEASQACSVYLNLHAYHKAQHADGYSPFTQAVQIAFALNEALDELADEGGWENRRRTYGKRAQQIAATLNVCGLTTLLPSEEYSAVLWTWNLPKGWTYSRVHDALKEEGFIIYAGQGNLASQVFRIAHMGAIDSELDSLCELLQKCFS